MNTHIAHTGTLVIGGGQAGLAASRCLSDRGCDHLVLERGRIAERWHSERWDSLRLLTPNWMTRVPGHAYGGDDPDGFMSAREVAGFFAGYAASFRAPVLEHVNVQRVAHDGQRFSVTTDAGRFTSDQVVIATGWCDRPAVPAAAASLAPDVRQIVPRDYRRPDDLPLGGVLVVGASATGVQLAAELHQSGRPVTLAVGSHTRMPRRYRGMDTFWWLDQIGAFDRTIDDVDDVDAARREPSLQLAGRPDHTSLDLAALEHAGVRLVGRVEAIEGRYVSVATDLAAVIDAADRRLRRTLRRIDDTIAHLGLGAEVLDAEPLPKVVVRDQPASLDLAADGIAAVVWATGHRRSYDWLDLPILRDGEIRQRRGVTALSGAYVLGQRFQHFRNSNFIDGVGRDAAFVADHICARADSLGARSSTRTRPR